MLAERRRRYRLSIEYHSKNQYIASETTARNESGGCSEADEKGSAYVHTVPIKQSIPQHLKPPWMILIRGFPVNTRGTLNQISVREVWRPIF